MSAIRTTAFTIWIISIVIAFEFGITLPDKIDQLAVNTNNIPTMVFVFFIAVLLLHFIGMAQARWNSDTTPMRLSVIGNFIERERLEKFVLAVQPTKLLIVCAATIGLVGTVQTANTSQASLAYIASMFFLLVSAGQFFAQLRRDTNKQSNDDV